MTLQASSLTLGLSSTPGDSTYVKGTKDVSVVAFNFSASLASALKVTNITLTGYVADSGATLEKGVGTNADSSLTTSGLVSAVKLYDGDTGTLISDTPSTNNLNNSTGTVIFNNLTWNIPAGTTKKLLVKADLSTNPTSGSSDTFSFDIDATTDVTALDASSQTVNAGQSDPNVNTAPTNQVTVSSGGSINLALAPSNPNKKAVYWGQNDALFTVYRYRATDEAFFIERLNIVTASAGGEVVASATANIDSVKLEYTNVKAGVSTTLTALGALDATTGSVSFGFVGDQRPYIPKDSSVDVKIFANIKAKAPRTGTALSSPLGSEALYSLDISNGQDDEFRAVGEGSGSVKTNADITDSQKSKGNDHYTFRTYPEFVQDTLLASEPLGIKDVLKFTIKVWGVGGSKLLFDDNASATIRFEIVASGAQSATDMTARLYDLTTNDQVASQTVSNGQTSLANKRASVTFDSWDKNLEIDAGSQKSFRVELGFTGFTDKSDFFQLVLNDGDANSIVRYVDGANSAENNTVDLGGSTAPGKNLGSVFRLLPMNGPVFVKQ